MKFRLWGTVAIVSQSWRQSTLGVLVIRMPHDDKCLTGHTETGIVLSIFQKDRSLLQPHTTTEKTHYIPVTCCETEWAQTQIRKGWKLCCYSAGIFSIQSEERKKNLEQ